MRQCNVDNTKCTWACGFDSCYLKRKAEAESARPPQSTAEKLLLVPLVDLRTYVDAMDAQQREGAERELAHLSQRAATLSAYMEHYTLHDGAHDTTDKTHNAAVKHAQRVTTRVRKALGYTYPKFDVSF